MDKTYSKMDDKEIYVKKMEQQKRYSADVWS